MTAAGMHLDTMCDKVLDRFTSMATLTTRYCVNPTEAGDVFMTSEPCLYCETLFPHRNTMFNPLKKAQVDRVGGTSQKAPNCWHILRT